jgi:hypothetical protein
MQTNSLSRLAQALLNGPHHRMMLSSKELAELHLLDQMNVPIEQMLKWIEDGFNQSTSHQKRSLLTLIKSVKTKAQRWQKHHIGERFNQEPFIQAEQIQKAFLTLIQSVHFNASEHHQTHIVALFQWLESQLKAVLDTYTNEPALNPIHLLRDLSERVRIRALTTLDHTLLERIQTQAKEHLKNESSRCRPQDLVLTHRALEWRLLREEIRLPELYLNLYGEW